MRFYKVTVAGQFIPDGDNTRNLGAVGSRFANVYSVIFTGNLTGNVTGNVLGDLTGDLYNPSGVRILDNGGASVASSKFLGQVVYQ